MRYPALVEVGGEDYGVAFPDLPGCVAMGCTMDEALVNAQDALQDWMNSMEEHGNPIPPPSALEDVEVPKGCALMSILVVREAPDQPSVRLNLVLDADVANTITSQARSRGMSRKNYIAWMMKTLARMGV
jgi:predicted RNase H-like HicB family nuclease